LSQFDLNLLVALDCLLRVKNVTAAASELGVSQPTMSGMLRRLRESFNDLLLVRVGRSFELTPRASEISERVRQTLLAVDALVTPPGNFELAQAQRHFRIMASDASLLFVLPYVFRSAAVSAPNLTFEVVPVDSAIEQVYSGTVDLCLTGDTVEDVEGGAASVVRTKLLASAFAVGVVDQFHPLRGNVTLEQFLSYPYVATAFPGMARTAEDNIHAGLAGVQPPRIRVPSFAAVGAIVKDTEMIGVLPARLVPILPQQWNLRTIGLPADFGRMSLRALWHSRVDKDPVHRWLRAKTLEACAEADPMEQFEEMT